MCLCVYIYIYKAREREKEGERRRVPGVPWAKEPEALMSSLEVALNMLFRPRLFFVFFVFFRFLFVVDAEFL